MRRLLPWIVLVAGLFFVGDLVRERMNLDLTPAGVQAAVTQLGWRAPAGFVGMVTFRQFLLMPSALLLSAGGVLFGVWQGTLLGSLGILLSALVQYGLAREVANRWLRRRLGSSFASIERRAQPAGPMLVALMTGHPAGAMTPVHLGAGLTAVALSAFVLAVALTAPLRAFAYSLFGSTLLAFGTPRFWIATAVLAAAILVPLAHPGLRAWYLGVLREARSDRAGDA